MGTVGSLGGFRDKGWVFGTGWSGGWRRFVWGGGVAAEAGFGPGTDFGLG